MGKVKKKTSKKKWDFEQFELIRVVWDDATADKSWIGLEDAGKLADARLFLSTYQHEIFPYNNGA